MHLRPKVDGGPARFPLKRVDCVNCLITRPGSEAPEILLVWNADWRHPTWSLPGGAREQQESLAEAGRRETREETGLDIEVGDLVDLHEIIGLGGRVHLVIYTFRCSVRGGDFIADGASEPRGDGVTSAAWFPMDQARNMDWLKRVLSDEASTPTSVSRDTGDRAAGATYSCDRRTSGGPSLRKKRRERNHAVMERQG